MKRRTLELAGGWLLAAVLWLVAGASTLPLPVVEHERGITVRAEGGMRKLAREVAATAPATLESIRADLPGLPSPPQIEIRLIRDAAELADAAPPGRGAPEWASGVAYSDLGVVIVAHRSGSQLIDVKSVVRHELAHLMLGAATGHAVPRWLNEGFAYIHSAEWSVDRTQTLTGMAWTGQTIPIAELDRRFPAQKSEVDRAYAQSFDFVAFLARRGRHADRDDDGDRWPFREFLGSLAAGASLDDAAELAYGATIAQLAEEWHADLRDRYLLVPAGLFGFAVWILAAILLIFGYLRRRRQNRATLARWADEEARSDRPDASSPDAPHSAGQGELSAPGAAEGED